MRKLQFSKPSKRLAPAINPSDVYTHDFLSQLILEQGKQRATIYINRLHKQVSIQEAGTDNKYLKLEKFLLVYILASIILNYSCCARDGNSIWSFIRLVKQLGLDRVEVFHEYLINYSLLS